MHDCLCKKTTISILNKALVLSVLMLFSCASTAATLTALKTTSTVPDFAGNTANYTITVSNSSDPDAQDVVITDTPESVGFTYASSIVSLNGGATRPSVINPSVGDNVMSWSNFIIPNGGSVEIDVTINVASNVPADVYNNSVNIATSTAGAIINDYDGAANTAEDVVIHQLSPLSGSLVINEVLFRATGNGAAANDEFIELYNAGSTPISLSGLMLIDGNKVTGDLDGTTGSITGDTMSFDFSCADPDQTCSGPTSLLPGQYAVIWVGDPAPTRDATGAIFQAWLGQAQKLANGADDVWLFGANNEFIDYVAWGSSSSVNTEYPISVWDTAVQTSLDNVAAGTSISLTPNGVDGNDSNCWEETLSAESIVRCAAYLPTVNTDSLAGRISSAGANNNGIAAIMIEKSSATTTIAAPGSVTYEYLVTNIEGVIINGLTLFDDNADAAPVCAATSLTVAPDAGSTTTCTATYTVTQADIDNNGSPTVGSGNVVNNVTASTIEAPDVFDNLSIPIAQLPNFSVDKTQTGGPNPASTIGDVLDYTITVVNTGNITLTGVAVTDTLPDGSVGTLSTVVETLSTDGVFELGETWTYTISYAVTADDLTDGSDLVNTVSAATTQVPGPIVDTAVTPLNAPSLIVSKSLPGLPVDLGGGVYQITYNFNIENDGNVDFTNLQLLDDLNAMINNPNVNGASVSNAQVTYVSGTVLTPNGSYTGTGSNNMLAGSDMYPVGATTVLSLSFDFTPDVYFGPFNNTAQVSGVDPLGVTEVDNSENNVSPTQTSIEDDIQSSTPFMLSVPTTPITLGWINITDNLNGSALIEWQTATEVANAGFNILVLSDTGELQQVNDSMISSQGDSTGPQNYEYFSDVVGEEFMLVDVSVTGVEKQHGPFKLNESSGMFVEPSEIDWSGIQQESQRKAEQRELERREELQNRVPYIRN